MCVLGARLSSEVEGEQEAAISEKSPCQRKGLSFRQPFLFRRFTRGSEPLAPPYFLLCGTVTCTDCVEVFPALSVHVTVIV